MTTPLNSPQNRRFRLALRLRGHSGRMDQRRFLIDGVREILRAAESAWPLDELWFCGKLANPGDLHRVIEAAESPTVVELSLALWKKIAFGDRTDGLLAVAQAPQLRLSDVPLPDRPLVVILDRVEKPGNIGAIARTSDAVGANLLIVADGTRDLYNPNTIRASAGAVFGVPLVAARFAEVRDWLTSNRLSIVVARTDAVVEYHRSDLRPPLALVLGSEAVGVSSDWLALEPASIRLPMLGKGDSLNVSVTAAVLLYESLRQQHV